MHAFASSRGVMTGPSRGFVAIAMGHRHDAPGTRGAYDTRRYKNISASMRSNLKVSITFDNISSAIGIGGVQLAPITNRGESSQRESLVAMERVSPGLGGCAYVDATSLSQLVSLQVGGSQSLFRGGSNIPDPPPGKRRIPQGIPVLRRNSLSALRIYLKMRPRARRGKS